jgi:hypothetical protein
MAARCAVRLALYQRHCIYRDVPRLGEFLCLVARLYVNRVSVCQHRKEMILPNQPRWAAREPDEFWHFKCAEAAKLTSGKQCKSVVAVRPHPD